MIEWIVVLNRSLKTGKLSIFKGLWKMIKIFTVSKYREDTGNPYHTYSDII